MVFRPCPAPMAFQEIPKAIPGYASSALLSRVLALTPLNDALYEGEGNWKIVEVLKVERAGYVAAARVTDET